MGKQYNKKLSRNYYYHFLVGFFVFMVSFMISGLASSVFTPVGETSAQTISVENRATGYYVAVASPDSVSLDVSPTPSGSSVVSSANVVNVKTNAPLGYKLYLSTEDDELKSSDSSISQTFKPVTSTSLSVNTWGFSKTGTDNSWLAVPEVVSGKESTGYLLSSATAPNTPNGDSISVYYGVNSDTSMPTGTYTTTVTYTAIGDGIPEEHTMQEFTMAECINMPVDQTFYLIDSRNNKIYSIIHAKDGNCWMTQNLSIYNQTISDADSDLPSGTTITLPESTNWDTNDYTNMRIHVADGTGKYANKTGEYYGEVYYNWVAATGGSTASSGTANQSLCPKGWRLPINSDATQDKSWAKLMNAYNVTTGPQLMNSSNPAYILGFHKYYGYWAWYLSSENNQGYTGHSWSSTASSSANAYYFEYDAGNIYTQRSDGKGIGLNVRCVFAPSMQEFSAADCAKISTDTQFVLTDTRNYKQYKIVKARDNNCWMADNLKYQNMPSTNWNTNDYSQELLHIATNEGYAGEYYYNYTSALSVCPTGWSLPINGDAATNKSYAKLMSAYNITTGAELLAQTSLGFTKYYGHWDFNSISEINQGVGGYFWSSTASSETNAYYLAYSSAVIDPQFNLHKGYGFNVRCVLH